MNDEYLKGYREGFKDGFETGRKEARLPDPARPIWDQPSPLFPQAPMQYEPRCPVCGMRWDKPMGYVCNNSSCPSKVTCGSTPSGKVTARFGSFSGQEYLNDTGC